MQALRSEPNYMVRRESRTQILGPVSSLQPAVQVRSSCCERPFVGNLNVNQPSSGQCVIDSAQCLHGRVEVLENRRQQDYIICPTQRCTVLDTCAFDLYAF